MSLQDDIILVQKILSGETETFRQVIERHQAGIYYLGLKFLHNHEAAEDFTQEVFMKAFTKIRSYQRKAPLGAWLYKLAFNHAVNRAKVNQRRLLAELPLPPEVLETVEGTGDLEATLLRTELQQAIRSILDGLPDIYNLMIRMHFYDHLGYRDISDIMDIPVNTIKSHIFRAKKMIRSRLEENHATGTR